MKDHKELIDELRQLYTVDEATGELDTKSLLRSMADLIKQGNKPNIFHGISEDLSVEGMYTKVVDQLEQSILSDSSGAPTSCYNLVCDIISRLLHLREMLYVYMLQDSDEL